MRLEVAVCYNAALAVTSLSVEREHRMPNFETILKQLRSERDRAQQELQRLEDAIRAIEAVNLTGRRRAGRPPRAAAVPRRRGRMSAAGRARIAAAQRARWAKAKQAEASKPVRRMSAAARRKMSRLMKQRWAQGKMKPRAKAE